MRAFKAFWLQALENGKTSGEDVWRGALSYALYKIRNAPRNISKDDIIFFLEHELKEASNEKTT